MGGLTSSAQGVRGQIAGWLVLPALITWLTPVWVLYGFVQLIPAANTIFASARDDLKTWTIFELIFNVAIIIGWLRALYLLWTRDEAFPRTFIALLLISFVGAWLDVALVSYLLPTADLADSGKDAGQATVKALVWVPYMLLSKRVKHTFGLPLAKRPITPERRAIRRKANRMGIFVTLAAAVSFLLGLLLFAGENAKADAFSIFLMSVGTLGTLLGYVLVRVWYWAAAAGLDGTEYNSEAPLMAAFRQRAAELRNNSRRP